MAGIGIVSSSIISRNPQEDGRVLITEEHIYSDGTSYRHTYLLEVGMDENFILSECAKAMGAELDLKAAQLALAMNYTLPISKVEYLLSFSEDETLAIQTASLTDKTVAQAMVVLANTPYVYLNHPIVISSLAHFEATGLIGPGRKEQIRRLV